MQVSYFISVDPKIKWVPQRILDPVYQAVIKEIFTRIMQNSQTFSMNQEDAAHRS